MEKRNNKNKKRLLILVALVGVMGIGGVVAATSISINSGAPLSLGAGYATATTCDEAVTVTPTQAYDTGRNTYVITEVQITGIDIVGTSSVTGLGCGAVPGKILQLAIITTSGTSSASWSLASLSGQSARIYSYSSLTAASSTGGTYYASVALASFSMSTLSTVALSIA